MPEPARLLALHDDHLVEIKVDRVKFRHRTPFCMTSNPNNSAGGAVEKTGDHGDNGSGGGGVDRAASPVASLSTEVDSDLVVNVSVELRQVGRPATSKGLIQDLIDYDSGLSFLKEVTRSHSVYIDTVVARLFFEVKKTWTWRLGITELRRSDFLSQLDALELNDDFMNVEEAFPYKDAYVIHTMFNSPDKDNDRLLSKVDLTRYEKSALLPKAIDRVFDLLNTSAMTYADLIFLLAEKDKSHPMSIEYWFNRLHLDGDGIVTMYELETFFHEQYHCGSLLMNYPASFEDICRQMIDLVKPETCSIFALCDLKRCALASVFKTFINTVRVYPSQSLRPVRHRAFA
ncbi:hypothetical protein MTO96_048327 [Rhipicephalus appendiculatus]